MKNKKRLLIVILFALLIIVMIYRFFICNENSMTTKQIFSMDTSVKLTIDGDEPDDYIKIIRSLDKRFSSYNSESEISKLNANGEAKLSEETIAIITKAVKLHEKYPQVDITAGALTKLWNVTDEEPTVPKNSDITNALKTVGSDNIHINDSRVTLRNNAQIDLGSCAKGYALDLLFEQFEKNKEQCAIVTFGSSSLLYGEKKDGKPFVTAVTDPDNSNSQVLEFTSAQCFVSTSGGYERFFEADGKKYCHILDLENGYPTESDLTSVTVISEQDGMLTDFLSTCIFIGGTENIENYLDADDYAVIALDKEKKIYCSQKIRSSISIINKDYSFK